MSMTKEAARALLKIIQADAKAKVKTAGGESWTRVGASSDGMTLVIKVYCISDDESQTTVPEFAE